MAGDHAVGGGDCADADFEDGARSQGDFEPGEGVGVKAALDLVSDIPRLAMGLQAGEPLLDR